MNIVLNNKNININPKTTLKDLLIQNDLNHDVVGIKINNELSSYEDIVEVNDRVDFLYAYDNDGNKIYKSALKFILIVALKELYGSNIVVKFQHSIDKGICFTIEGINKCDINNIKLKMQEIVNSNYLFNKVNVNKKDAIKFYYQKKEYEKALNIQNISNSLVILYNLNGYFNYFYTSMPYSTGCIKYFDIIHIKEQKYVLLFPIIGKSDCVLSYHHYPLNMNAFTIYDKWIEELGINYVCDVNNLVSSSKIADFIQTNELYLQQKILNQASIIKDNKNIKFVLMAGPSSSGKTTTSKKLSIALKTYGKQIFNLSIDDYYLDQKLMPKELVEKRDFESVDLIDRNLLAQHLRKLVNHEEVQLPTYNFTKGIKEFNDKPVSIDDNTIIVIEGIHALNDKLFASIPQENKYKIYVSPFEPLSIDRHNHMSTTDLRLLRRLVRDNRFRGVGVEDTLKSWQNVRNGEEKYIFPYMEFVDCVLNTSLIYEVGVLKVYAEPLLYSVRVDSPYYEEAQRLIEFLKTFYPIISEYVPNDSLLREFIGGSVFE